VLEIRLLVQPVNLTSLGAKYGQRIEALAAALRGLPLVIVLVGYALIPAIFEELFFRGYLFSALRAHAGPALTIIGTALFFGLFHLVGSVDQFVSSTLLGLVLGAICWQTGSVFPGMVLHTCHNAFILCLSYFQEDLGWFNPETAGVPVEWLLGGAVGICMGVALLYFASSRRERNEGLEIDPVEVIS
jgi:membrane protease YdiL (CAAX protease family)